jgi:hypothetical protein
MGASESQIAAGERQTQAGPGESTEAFLRGAVVASAGSSTNQAERAALHPNGDDVEWRYYHGGWSS